MGKMTDSIPLADALMVMVKNPLCQFHPTWTETIRLSMDESGVLYRHTKGLFGSTWNNEPATLTRSDFSYDWVQLDV